jgi:hypothetical protein
MTATTIRGSQNPVDDWHLRLGRQPHPWEQSLLENLPAPLQLEWRKMRTAVGKDKKHPTPVAWDDDTVSMRVRSIIAATRAATRAGFPPGSILDFGRLEVLDAMLVVLAETCGPHTRALILGAIRAILRSLGSPVPRRLSRLITELQGQPRIDKSDRIRPADFVIARAMTYCRLAQYGMAISPDRAAHRARRAALVATGAQTAFRLGELAGMHRKEVRFYEADHVVFYSDESASKEEKAGREETTARYTAEIIRFYLDPVWLKLAEGRPPTDDAPLWISRGGNMMDKNAVCEEIRRTSRFLVGVELSCNLFRRYYADLDDDREAGRKLRNGECVRYRHYASRTSEPETAHYQKRRAQLAAIGRNRTLLGQGDSL